MYDVFISYNNVDEPFARRLHQVLAAKGVRAFFASESLRAGDSHVSEINKALSSCRVGIVVWSKSASQSRYVEAEFNAMHDLQVYNRLRVIVVARDNTNVPPLYSHLHRILPGGATEPEEVAEQVMVAASFGTEAVREPTVEPRATPAEFRSLIPLADLDEKECDILFEVIRKYMKSNPAGIAAPQSVEVQFQGAKGRRLAATLNKDGLATSSTVRRAQDAIDLIVIYQANITTLQAALQTPAALQFAGVFTIQIADNRSKMGSEYETLRECLDLFVIKLWSIEGR